MVSLSLLLANVLSCRHDERIVRGVLMYFFDGWTTVAMTTSMDAVATAILARVPTSAADKATHDASDRSSDRRHGEVSLS
jgi:hypothetical protein